jgi:hypothetical protein
MKRIKRLEEFESLNEGILSSIFGGIGNLFTSRKTKVESLLKDIRKAREEDINNTINLEKEIWNLPKDNTPEYKFTLTNLNRQQRTYSSLKGQEINSLMKEADKLIEADPKLQAMFSSGLAQIEAETTEKLIKSIKPYKDQTYLDKLNKEFDTLVRDANKKTSYYEGIKDNDGYSPRLQVPSNVSNDSLLFIDMSTQESALFVKNLSDKELNRYHQEIREFYYELEFKYDESIKNLKKDIRKAYKDGQNWLVDSLEKEEVNIRYKMKKPIDRLKQKIVTIEKEIKSRRYANY